MSGCSGGFRPHVRNSIGTVALIIAHSYWTSPPLFLFFAAALGLEQQSGQEICSGLKSLSVRSPYVPLSHSSCTSSIWRHCSTSYIRFVREKLIDVAKRPKKKPEVLLRDDMSRVFFPYFINTKSTQSSKNIFPLLLCFKQTNEKSCA